MKKALISGTSGMDGRLLAYQLLEKGYQVFGMVRQSASRDVTELNKLALYENFKLVEGDLLDQGSLDRLVKQIQPDYLYNMGALSFVGKSWDQPELTAQVTGLGVLRCLEAIRKHQPECKFLTASSSEMFGDVLETPQKETTPFNPQSPYGVAKVFGAYLTDVYRKSYDIKAFTTICFNHCGKTRGKIFVTRKITSEVAKMTQEPSFFQLGNLEAKRDWGSATDYTRGMIMIMEKEGLMPDDFILATGETHTVREWLEASLQAAGLNFSKYGEELQEVYSIEGGSKISINPDFYRPAEVDLLLGDAGKIKELVGWEPTISFKELVIQMVEHDISLLD